jgi:hypothetical protein
MPSNRIGEIPRNDMKVFVTMAGGSLPRLHALEKRD